MWYYCSLLCSIHELMSASARLIFARADLLPAARSNFISTSQSLCKSPVKAFMPRCGSSPRSSHFMVSLGSVPTEPPAEKKSLN